MKLLYFIKNIIYIEYMIPKLIHYCWISDEQNMPANIKECINSWHKYLPDYEFINWNDSNFNWNISTFTKHCRENNLYAFCSDYIRYWALYNYGGIYLDSDVMVYKSFDDLLQMKRILTKEIHKPFDYIEAAIIGSEKNDKIFEPIIDFYDNCPLDFSYTQFIVAPNIMTKFWNKYYKLLDINDPNKESKEDNILSILNVDKYFNSDSKYAYAEHKFIGSWRKYKNIHGIDIKI